MLTTPTLTGLELLLVQRLAEEVASMASVSYASEHTRARVAALADLAAAWFGSPEPAEAAAEPVLSVVAA